MMAAERFNFLIQFRRATFVDDGLTSSLKWDADNPDNDNHGTPIRAAKGDISASELVRAGEVAANVTVRFRVRSSNFTRALTPKDRLVCDGREYDISGIKEIGRRYMLDITAAARAD